MELQWPLILFTTLLAWAAGLFAAQCVWALRGKGARAQMPALITSAVLLVVGGIAVFFHLEHWERIFSGFGHLTSGITRRGFPPSASSWRRSSSSSWATPT